MARIQYIVEASLNIIWILALEGLYLFTEPKWSWRMLGLLGIFILNVIVVEVLKKRGVWVKTIDPGSKVYRVIRILIFALLMSICGMYESFISIAMLYAVGLVIYENVRIYRANFVNRT